jgi:hypothetical protein
LGKARCEVHIFCAEAAYCPTLPWPSPADSAPLWHRSVPLGLLQLLRQAQTYKW